MAEHIFSDNPDDQLNRKIEELSDAISGSLLNSAKLGMIRSICREIYVMGFDDGEAYVWKLRQGL